MLIKAGVDISRLERHTRRSLSVVGSVLNDHKFELVITSTYDGNHIPGSLHYAHCAYDIRVPAELRRVLVDSISDNLGEHFDVIWEADHIHIEYDPK